MLKNNTGDTTHRVLANHQDRRPCATFSRRRTVASSVIDTRPGSTNLMDRLPSSHDSTEARPGSRTVGKGRVGKPRTAWGSSTAL